MTLATGEQLHRTNQSHYTCRRSKQSKSSLLPYAGTTARCETVSTFDASLPCRSILDIVTLFSSNGPMNVVLSSLVVPYIFPLAIFVSLQSFHSGSTPVHTSSIVAAIFFVFHVYFCIPESSNEVYTAY